VSKKILFFYFLPFGPLPLKNKKIKIFFSGRFAPFSKNHRSVVAEISLRGPRAQCASDLAGNGFHVFI
jgi:hypothetical protein